MSCSYEMKLITIIRHHKLNHTAVPNYKWFKNTKQAKTRCPRHIHFLVQKSLDMTQLQLPFSFPILRLFTTMPSSQREEQERALSPMMHRAYLEQRLVQSANEFFSYCSISGVYSNACSSKCKWAYKHQVPIEYIFMKYSYKIIQHTEPESK